MAKNSALTELRGLVCAWLRYIETKQAANNDQKLRQLATIDDNELLKKWLWIVCFIGGPISFIASPLLLGLLHPLLPALVTNILWIVVRTTMAITLILFILAVFLTIRESSSE